MKRLASLVLAGTMALSVPAQANDAALGAILGAAGGGLIGSQLGKGNGRAAATVAGVALGAVLGSQIAGDRGRQHRHDRRRVVVAPPPAVTAYPPRYNPYAYSGYVAVERPTCRQVEEDIYINGLPGIVYRTACRQPDGTWKIVR